MHAKYVLPCRLGGGASKGPAQTWKVPKYVVILESGCDIYSYYPKNLASASVTTTFPTVQTNLGPAAFIQSAPADLWRSLKESLSSSAYLIQVLLLRN